ncbi:MAG: AAA family ATPase [Hyphomicrobiaceae bacterium]
MTAADKEARAAPSPVVAPEQREVVDFLGDPASYSPPPASVQRSDTHGAHVFLAGDRAVKIKRAVRYDYMDFSTLERRRRFLERELEINKPAAPEIYCRVTAITRGSDGTLQVGGSGVPVEWALIMRRFEQSQLLSKLAEAGALDTGLAKALADAVLASHAAAPRLTERDSVKSFGAIIAELAATFEAEESRLGRASPFGQRAAHALERARNVLALRAAGGFVRRCHGDLHLDNVVLWKGHPTLFDAIEFDEDMATIDTLYDLAFLLMDLDFRGARPAANGVLNRYLWRSGSLIDIDGLAAMPLMLGLRAAIRAMVRLQRASLHQGPERQRDEKVAVAYHDAALRYLDPKLPRLLAVGGFSGTGKSTLAAAMAPRLDPSPGAVHLRSDLERKAIHGIGETERLPDRAYTAQSSERVYEIVAEKAAHALDAGHSVVVDAVYSAPGERNAIRDVAQSRGIPFAGIWLEAATDVLVRRVDERTGDASDATAEVVRAQLARGAGEIDWMTIDASGSRDDTLRTAWSKLSN